jgi:crotonobetainyl-CoA:carnitine CoA-transferase CaiB-like acyl-CoA transferase
MAVLLHHPYTRGREAIVDVEDSELGVLPMHNVVPRLTGSPGGFRRPAPGLGEHTAEILAELDRLP